MATRQYQVRLPRWLKRGGILPDGNLYCYSWGFNCASWEFGSPFSAAFRAPGAKSRHADPALTELAQDLNSLLAKFAKAQKAKHKQLRVLLLDDGPCLAFGDAIPGFDKMSEEEQMKVIRKGTDLELMTAAEVKKAFDL